MNNSDNYFKLQISGGMTAGKTTLSQYVLSEVKNTVQVSFAQPIYQIIDWWVTYKDEYVNFSSNKPKYILESLLFDMYEDLELALQARINIIQLLTENYQDTNWQFKDTRHRKLLQNVGDVLRDIRQTVIIDYLVKRSNQLIEQGKNVICDDARYPKEVSTLSSCGFISVRLEIDKETQLARLRKEYGDDNLDKLIDRLNHPTEVALKDFNQYDYKIDATLPLDDVYRKIDEIINLYK